MKNCIATLGEPKRLDLTGEKPGSSLWSVCKVPGKTTVAAKLAKNLKNPGRKSDPEVAADPYRPAADNQLQSLGEKIDVAVFAPPGPVPQNW